MKVVIGSKLAFWLWQNDAEVILLHTGQNKRLATFCHDIYKHRWILRMRPGNVLARRVNLYGNGRSRIKITYLLTYKNIYRIE